MNKIEIARRCHACGASVRDHALFCPQCGTQLEKSVSDQADTDVRKVSPRSWADRSEHQIESPTLMLDESRLASKVEKSATAQSRSRSQPHTRAKPDDGMPRPFEELRKVSDDILEDVSHDPSLRFLVIAAALFIVFLFLLLFSKLLG